MAFENKKIGQEENLGENIILNNYKKKINIGFLIKFIVIVASIFLVYHYSTFAVNIGKNIFKSVSVGTVKIISSSFGEEMKKDEYGQINMLLIGYGGEDHQGGFLSDTIIVASFNPKLGTVSFLSIPRDLYILDKPMGYNGRINGIFGLTYMRTKNFDESVAALKAKVYEITGISTDYYALIDFKGFTRMIDSLGGVDIDVPYDLVDAEYPDGNWGYEIFKVSKGIQHFDGKTALKYARSRHSSSDFSRSLRQQQIIKAVMDKVVNQGYLTSIDKIKELYGEYTNMLTTNISLKNMLGMAKYMDKIKNLYSFGYSVCSAVSYKTTEPGCFLYYPPRAEFGGMSTILPIGGSISNISNYKDMQNFAYIVIYEQGLLLENAKIKIANGIDKKQKKSKYGSSFSPEETLAIKLKKNAFNIIDTEKVKNANYEENTLYINGTGDYSNTIRTLKTFVDINRILTGDQIMSSGSNTKNDLTLVLGNNFVNK